MSNINKKINDLVNLIVSNIIENIKKNTHDDKIIEISLPEVESVEYFVSILKEKLRNNKEINLK